MGELFKSIGDLLKDSGELIIVEREELTIGESPYDEGFLMMTECGAKKLFGDNNIKLSRHSRKSYIVKYTISKKGLVIDKAKIKNCIEQIKKDSLFKIKEIKKCSSNNDKNIQKYKMGIKLAFYLQQYANASILCENIEI